MRIQRDPDEPFFFVAVLRTAWYCYLEVQSKGVCMGRGKELMGASTGVLLLGLLNDSPSYGYEVVKRLKEKSSELFEWQEGTVYPVLHRLEKEGLVRGQWQDAEAGKGPRRRKYYYITAKGRRALAEQQAQWEAFYGLIRRVAGGAKAVPAG
jgi:PadR family transcriptional regulator, regulatory protein PadR